MDDSVTTVEADPIAVLLQSVWTDGSRGRQVGKQAVPIAGIANLVSYNYMIYHNQYEEMEFGQFLHQGNLTDLAWERSALKHVASAHTPTMLTHGKTTTTHRRSRATSIPSTVVSPGTKSIFRAAAEGVTNVRP